MPKTGGTTINKIIKRKYDSGRIFSFPDAVFRQYGENWKRVPDKERWETSRRAFIELPKSEKSKLDAVFGHLWFGVHKYTDVQCRYVTFLRHPVRRYVSYFNFIHNLEGHRSTAKVREKDLSLEDFLENRRLSQLAENQQVKFLTGEFSPTIGSLKRAVRNIEDHFLHVGITENFDEDLLRIAESLGWGIPLYTRKNVSEKIAKVSELEPMVLNEILRRNRLDMALYEYVTSRRSGELRLRTRLFRVVNWLYGKISGRYLRRLV